MHRNDEYSDEYVNNSAKHGKNGMIAREMQPLAFPEEKLYNQMDRRCAYECVNQRLPFGTELQIQRRE